MTILERAPSVKGLGSNSIGYECQDSLPRVEKVTQPTPTLANEVRVVKPLYLIFDLDLGSG